MTRRHVAVIPGHGTAARAGGVTFRNLGVEDAGDPATEGFFTPGVELVVDHWTGEAPLTTATRRRHEVSTYL
jgi:hypothetical protein